MGFRFSLRHANWLANVLRPAGATLDLDNRYEEEETLRRFVESFEDNFFASRYESNLLKRRLREITINNRGGSGIALMALRDHFQGTPWVALLLPSGTDEISDEMLTDRNLLKELVTINPDSDGVILQLDEIPQEAIELDYVFPAFKVALEQVTKWPGLLVWTPSGDAAFFELSKDVVKIRERLRWLLSRLYRNIAQPDLRDIQEQYSIQMLMSPIQSGSLRILHLSDLHLGSDVARRRLGRVQTIIRSVVRELNEDGPIVPVITGDLMDSPSEENLGDVRAFMDFLTGLGIEKPLVVLGNHDVREDGWLGEKFRQAVNISTTPVIWMDNYQVGFACFNSVNGGRMARGWLGEQELAYVGNALDKEQEKASKFTIIGLIHHHPIAVVKPGWYRSSWYERFLGTAFEKTEVLEDAKLFLEWLKAREVKAVLHGHKHIPRFDKHGEIAVIGCGSTVGKVDTKERGHTFMSLNVLTVDNSQNLIGCRLRAERIPGAGLEAVESHELVLKSDLSQNRYQRF